MLREDEFRGALERLLTAYHSGTYEEWREAMHQLAVDTSPEQWETVIERFRWREHPAVTGSPELAAT
jgi:hypothetical protein